MIIGRDKEVKILEEAYEDKVSRFIVIYGRRRIGKTFLVKEVFKDRLFLNVSGIYNKPKKTQLNNFKNSLIKLGLKEDSIISDWYIAFSKLEELIKESKVNKKVIFIDELSWIDTKKSNFLSAFENFWNSFCFFRDDILLIVSSSATSYILKKVIHNKGGLYNRATNQIYLTEFSLKECKELGKYKNLGFGLNQYLECYMYLGGIPYYWDLLKKELTLEENINDLFFNFNSMLKDEYHYVFDSLFESSTLYKEIIDFLLTKNSGYSRKEITSKLKIVDNGNLTTILEELELSGFIKKYSTYNESKGYLYRVIDNFLIFNNKIVSKKGNNSDYFLKLIASQTLNIFKGYAFELLILKHIKEVKGALGIENVVTSEYSFLVKTNLDEGIFGSQIDLLIDRNDKIINLCEIKYSDEEYLVEKKDVDSLRHKVSDFKKISKTKKGIMTTLISPYGAIKNSNSSIFNVILDFNIFF